MRRILPALLAVLMSTSLLPAVAGAEDSGGSGPGHVLDLTGTGDPLPFAPQGLSVDRFEAVTSPEIVDLTAHDGINLHTRVYRPDTSSDPDWRTPVILVHSPYYSGLINGDDQRSQDIVSMFTPKGYTVVLSDVRGTGHSGGCIETDDPDQARDFVTLVEHFAAQPWSNGKVGSYGKSYDAETQHAGAVLDPEGLVTMVSVAGISSYYDVPFFDGVPFTGEGALATTAYMLYDVDVPSDPAYAPQRLERHRCQGENYANGISPDGDMDSYMADRDFRHRVADVSASMLYVTGYNDPIVRSINATGWVDEFPTTVKAILGQWAHKYPYDAPDEIARDDWYDAVHAWFDHELLGLATGIGAWPNVQSQSEDNVWRGVDSFAGLGVEQSISFDGLGALTFSEQSGNQVTFDAPARHLSGQVFLDTVITLDQPDAHFSIEVNEVDTDGDEIRTITTGHLSATHREGLTRQIPVTPGHATPYRIQTFPFDVTLEEDSRLQIAISGSNGTLPAGSLYNATWHLDRTIARIPVADDRCGLVVATRNPSLARIPGCDGGVPQTTPLSDPPRSFGHDTTFRPVASTTTTIADTPAVREAGYLTMRDGVEIAVEVVRPEGDGPFPTLFTYDGYAAGADPDSGYAARYLPRGYALVGANLRGTSCSGGTFDFFQPAEAHDGYEITEWAAARPWSSGRVGMIGKSYPGITQIFVAETQPPSLAAISPGHYFVDAYRDIAFPGGIFNYAFASLWSFVAQPGPGYQAAPGDILNGDDTCAAHQEHHATNVRTNPFVQAQEHPYDDYLIRERSPQYALGDIEVPVYQALSWQDEQLMSRNTHALTLFDEIGVDYRAVLSNGDHGTYREPAQMAELDRFVEAHVEQRPVLRDGTPLADYLAEPPVTVFWEQGETTDPRWRTPLASWTDVAEPQRLYLTDGELTSDAPTAAQTTSYLHNVAGQQGNADGTTFGSGFQSTTAWDLYSPPPGTYAAFTSEPYDSDQVLLGSASADLWITATAPNVDIQVTLTEIRPDGSEVFVNQGWLRTEQRELDASASTQLRPVQTHYVADVRPLSLDQPSLVRVEVFPFGHVVREGSRLRMWVEAPTTVPQLEGFALDPTPAQVTIHQGPETLSALVLPATVQAPVPAAFAGPDGQPACGVVQRQPCRPDPLARPSVLPGPAFSVAQ